MKNKSDRLFMKEMFGALRAEAVKMKHTFLYPLHGAAPVLCAGVFLLYYRRAISGGAAQLCALGEVIGIALPVAVSLVCAGSVGLEEENRFQLFLAGTGRKKSAFLAKWLMLQLLGAAAILGAVALFAAASIWGFQREEMPVGVCAVLVLLLCFGSIPLYLEHLFLNLRFSKNVSLSLGAAQLLLSALFLTGLGSGRWQFFPCTWGARSVSLFAVYARGPAKENVVLREMQRSALWCPLILAVLYAIIRVWFHFFEGRACNE